MKPTNHFRWKPASYEEYKNPCATTIVGTYGIQHFALQQWWNNETEQGGEWRDVPVGDGEQPPEETK